MTDELEDEPLGEVMRHGRGVPPEVRLFQAKILQHVLDALSEPTSPSAAHDRDSARRWLRADNEQFRLFCTGAGWDAGQVAGWVARGAAGPFVRHKSGVMRRKKQEASREED